MRSQSRVRFAESCRLEYMTICVHEIFYFVKNYPFLLGKYKTQAKEVSCPQSTAKAIDIYQPHIYLDSDRCILIRNPMAFVNINMLIVYRQVDLT